MYSWSKYLIFFLFLNTSHLAQAQREAATWYFGTKTGFDFSGIVPRPLNNSSRSIIGPAAVTMSDKKTGQLLFYSDAVHIWNRQHRLMAHGDSLLGNYYIMQGCLALPVPGQDQQYYLFTLSATKTAAQLHYSIIDMKLNNDLGDIDSKKKNKLISGDLNYQLAAIAHENKRDYWLIARRWDSSSFYIYLVSSNGISLSSEQNIGPAKGQLLDTEGFLKASPNGRRLAYVTSGSLPVSLFDFDAETGILSHYINLGRLLSVGGISFSPDNSKLYVQNYTLVPNQAPYGKLRNIVSQFDLTLNNDADIADSGISVIANNPNTNIRADNQSSAGFYAMQLGLDGRLYGNSDYTVDNSTPTLGETNLYVINTPNSRGFACDIKYKAFLFGDGQAGSGFPNFLESYFNNLIPSQIDSKECDLSNIELFPNPVNNTLQIRFSNSCFQNYFLLIHDILGRIVYSYTIDKVTSAPIDLNQLAPGIYLVEIQIADRVIRKKITKI